MVFDQFLYNFFYNTTVSTMRHRTLLLLPVAAAALPPEAEKTHPPGQGNTVALKDGTAPKSSPKTP